MTKQNDTTKTRIRNLADTSNERLRAVLIANGVDVPNRASRSRLVGLAREAGLWGESGNVVPMHHKERYGAAQSCGDDVASALADHVRVPHPENPKKTVIDASLLAQVASANGLDLARWDHLNIGMQRMNLGNALRGMVKRGERVEVGTSVWNAEDNAAEAL